MGGATLNFIPVKNSELSLLNKYVSRQYLDNTGNKARSIDAFFVPDLRAAYTLKTKLAKEIIKSRKGSIYLDLENPDDRIKLTDITFFLSENKDKLICFDEFHVADITDAIVEGGRTALIGERDGQPFAWTYAELQAQANRIARVLVEDLGLVPGNRVLLRGANSPMLAACWFAVVKAGGIAVALAMLAAGGGRLHLELELVFAVLTFVLNFIPSIGSIIATGSPVSRISANSHYCNCELFAKIV